MSSFTPVRTSAPLLEGEDAARALAAVRAIAAWLRGREEPSPPAGPDARAASLAEGDAGIAVFFAALARSGLEPAAGHDAERHLNRAIDAVRSVVMPDSLHCGFPGVAWAFQHVERLECTGPDAMPDAAAPPDACEGIDRVLADHVGRAPWLRDFDVVNGLAGLAAYALERLPSLSARRVLERVVARLEELAEPAGDGLAWRTPPARLASERTDGRTHGPFNLGVAHGVPGVLAALAAAHEAGVESERTARLLEGGTRWLLAQRLLAGAGAWFPHSVGSDASSEPSRLAWCYGDLGIAATLHLVARVLPRPEWDAVAVEIARDAARRSRADGAVRDAGVCHGAAGIAQLFHRLGRGLGDPELMDATRRWLGDLLDRRDPSLGAAGFPAWGPADDGRWGWSEERGLLSGVSGVGLVLLGALEPALMGWDRTLLVSTRTAPDPR